MAHHIAVNEGLENAYVPLTEESSFTAVFSDMKITECMWKAHDGQQPDAE